MYKKKNIIKISGLLSLLAMQVLYSCSTTESLSYEDVKNSNKWELRFEDSCKGNWQDNWFLDGKIATVENSDAGMNFAAGPEFRNDAHHAVLWTNDSFKGDVKVEFDYTRTDEQTINVNIIYIQAQGIGTDPYTEDISEWNHLREIPAMNIYYDYMNPLHISFAAFPMVNEDPSNDYIRARKYPQTESISFDDMEVAPSYDGIGLFKSGITYKVTVIKTDYRLYMQVEGDGQDKCYEWDVSQNERLEDGRIGLRHMYTRSARYANFKVYTK
ncbi:MAG: DUF1961 family protein [Rikenellaceae bacterium]